MISRVSRLSSSRFLLRSSFRLRPVAQHLPPTTYKPHYYNSIRTMCGHTDKDIPSTLSGPPVASIVPPGVCQFGDDLTAVSLLKRTKVSPTSYVLRFGLPDATKSLNLSTCACILANADINGENVTRPYTPISTNDDIGYFDLLIKDYPEHKAMSQFLTETLKPGESVKFKHIKFNIKMQYEEIAKLDKVCMLVGGTGVTPMIQALHAILGSSSAKPTVTMLYGSRTSDDILGKEVLHQWAAKHTEQFSLVDILSHEPEDSNWKGERGHIDRAIVEKYFPAPNAPEKFSVFICGPPPMYDALTGPRDDKEVVKGLLGEMGYAPEQVYKF